MRGIRWLVGLAENKPLLFNVAILLILMISLISIVNRREVQKNDCENKLHLLEKQYQQKMESLNTLYRDKNEQLNTEVKEVLNTVIDNYKSQLKREKYLDSQMVEIVKKNKAIINNLNNK